MLAIYCLAFVNIYSINIYTHKIWFQRNSLIFIGLEFLLEVSILSLSVIEKITIAYSTYI